MNIKRCISFLLILTMVTIPALAIIPPEDAMPVTTDRELIQDKVHELMRVRMQKGRRGISEEEVQILEQQENSIISEIDVLGATKMSSQQVSQMFGVLPEVDETSPNFEGLGHTDENSYFVYGPYSTTYNGQTMYYMEVLVAPCGNESYLWRNSSDIFDVAEDNEPFSSYKSKSFTTSPSSVQVTAPTPAHVFYGDSDVNDSTRGDYDIGIELATCVDYIYIGNRNSTDMTDYALGLISTAVECYETHKLDLDNNDSSGEGYRIVEYYNFADVDYALECYFSGHGFDIICPMDISYYFGGRYLGSGQVIQPYSSPYMYE